jgi:hypothetical protein
MVQSNFTGASPGEIMQTQQKYVNLTNNIKMPMVGFGTYQLSINFN